MAKVAARKSKLLIYLKPSPLTGDGALMNSYSIRGIKEVAALARVVEIQGGCNSVKNSWVSRVGGGGEIRRVDIVY